MGFTLRTDSREILDRVRHLFLNSAFTARPGAPSEFDCFCGTCCDDPWAFAIEAPDGLHLARAHRSQASGFEFFEWTPAGFCSVGDSYSPVPPRDHVRSEVNLQILTAYLKRRLLRLLLNRNRASNLKVLHAASLQHDHGGLLILGDSRSGKSTLALACALDGMRFLAEEDSVIDLREGRLIPFPVPFRIREGTLSLSSVFGRLPREATTDMQGDVRWLVDPVALRPDAIGTAVPLSHVLRLRARRDRPCLETANGAEMAQACAIADVFGRDAAPLDSLWQWAGRIHRARCADLYAGPLDATVSMVKSWLSEPAA